MRWGERPAWSQAANGRTLATTKILDGQDGEGGRRGFVDSKIIYDWDRQVSDAQTFE